ncbi:hypothetical protein BH24GEM1_BH24GEM1_25520 [soil metagenome]
MSDQGKLIGGALAGAGLMFLLDPDRGTRRRALLRDQAARARHKLGDGLEATARDVGNRARGSAAELRSRFRKEDVDDEVLHERVRSAIGRAVSHPGAIAVTASTGRVTLQGPVLEHELDDLLRDVRRVRGVSEVDNQLEVHREPGGVPALQGDRPRESRPDVAQDNWAPATRVTMGAVGGALAFQGLRGRGLPSMLLLAAGAGVLLRALTNLPFRRLTGVGAERRAVVVQKSIEIDVPVERVWDLWSNYENFPRFMRHIEEVRRTSEGRSHWVAVGPAGSRFEWDATTTVSVPNEVLAWCSEEGSAVENAGIVRFRHNPDGTSRIDVRISYNPPAGALGHAVASLFGTDPKRAMDEDMVRLKSLLEEGKTTGDEGSVRLDEVTEARPQN